MKPEPYDEKMDDKAIKREELIDPIEEKRLKERDKLIALIEDALAEFAPSIYSRSICRKDIEKWLEKRGNTKCGR